MAKRFSETEIWEEDWFLDMPNEYKLFWFYMLSKCDHAGIFKVNLKSFRGLIEVKLTSADALLYFNYGKQRVRVVSENIWYIEDFFVFQYGTTFNINNRMHSSIEKVLKKYNIELTTIRGLKDLKDTLKDKDKDKDNSSSVEKTKNSNAKEIPIVGTDLAVSTARLVWDDQKWRENTCLGQTISENDLKQWMAQFNASIANDSIQNFSASTYKKMFGGWLNTQKGKGYKLTEKQISSSPTLKKLS